MEMLNNPLMTEDGFINQACINELEQAIKNMPKTYDRLADDLEWNTKSWTSIKDITGAFAKWAIRQSPYAYPYGLEQVVGYFDACLHKIWKDEYLIELNLCDINKMLYDILYEKGISVFDAWNRAKVGETPKIIFCDAFSKSDPDRDFIDLDALLHNVCIEIRDARRQNCGKGID